MSASPAMLPCYCCCLVGSSVVAGCCAVEVPLERQLLESIIHCLLLWAQS
jgi:hypothetical protein